MYASLGYRIQDIDIFNVSSGASAVIQAQKGSVVEARSSPVLFLIGVTIRCSREWVSA